MADDSCMVDHDGRCAVLAMPAEMLGHVLRFLDLGGLVCASTVCGALGAPASRELHAERIARARLARRWPDLEPRDPPLLSSRGAAAACRRWGLAPERPFGAIARRAARTWIMQLSQVPAWSDGIRIGTRCSFGPPAHAPLCGGETICLRGLGDAKLQMPLDLDVGLSPGTTLCSETIRNNQQLLQLLPVRGCYGRKPDGTRFRAAIVFAVVPPCDPADAAALRRDAPAGDPGAFLDACLHYARRVRAAWGLAASGLMVSVDPKRRAVRWQLNDGARVAAQQHHERAGIASVRTIVFTLTRV